MKTNPLYNYLVKNNPFTSTKWIQKENLCLYPLAIQGNLGYFESESMINVTEHHISIFSEIDENLGFSSLYHYTAILSNNTKLHVYFDTNDKPFQVTLTSPAKQVRCITHLLEEAHSPIVDLCFFLEAQAQEIIQPLRAKQDILIDTLKTKYISQLTEITKSLFEQEQTMASIGPLIQASIILGEELLTICYKKKFFKATLRFLKQSLSCLEESQETVFEHQEMPTAITMGSEIVVQNSLIPSRMLADSVPDHPPQPKISNKLTIDETFQQRIKQFESAKKDYLSKLHIFKSEQNLSLKLKQFSEFVELDLPELNTPALCLEEIFKTLSKQQQIRLRQVSLEIALLTQNHEKEGVDLLFECLEQGNVDLLEIYKKTFKSVIIMLSREQVESFILKQNVSALQFLLINSEFNLNHYVIQMGGDQLLSPLCAAFELKNLDIFKMFLKNKASCLALYKDLPLAHTLLELDSKDCFHQAFFEYFLDLRGKNTINLYKTLASCILKKIKDQTLDESLKPPLRITYRKYIEILKGLESSTASKSTLTVSDFFDSSAFPEIGKLTWEEKKHLREFQLKLNELTAFASKHKTMHLGKIIDDLIKEAQRIFRAGSEDSIKSINKDKIIFRAQQGTECFTKMLRMLELSSKHRVTQNEIKELKALDLFFSDGDDSKDKLAKIAKKLDEIKTVAKQIKTLYLLRGQSFNRDLRLIYEELSQPNLWLKRKPSVLDFIHQEFTKLLQFEIGLQETAFSQRFYNRFTSSFDNFLKNMLFQCQDMPKDKTSTDPYGPGTIMSFH